MRIISDYLKNRKYKKLLKKLRDLKFSRFKFGHEDQIIINAYTGSVNSSDFGYISIKIALLDVDFLTQLEKAIDRETNHRLKALGKLL